MLLHIITGYFSFSIILTEYCLRNDIGKQEHTVQRIIFYVSGILFGPIAALIGIIIAIVNLIRHGVD